MARPVPAKKSEPAAPPTASKILPMELRVGDRLVDETGEWEVIGRPYTTACGQTAHVRVQRAVNPDSTQIRTWDASRRISVKRMTAEEGKR